MRHESLSSSGIRVPAAPRKVASRSDGTMFEPLPKANPRRTIAAVTRSNRPAYRGWNRNQFASIVARTLSS